MTAYTPIVATYTHPSAMQAALEAIDAVTDPALQLALACRCVCNAVDAGLPSDIALPVATLAPVLDQIAKDMT